jgi:hypothetical protein
VNRGASIAVLASITLTSITLAEAQIDYRPHDPLGLGIRVERVRIPHGSRWDEPGTSMALQQRDPWLAYEIGHSYFEREWTVADGLFRTPESRRFARGAANSCAMCHNLPFRTPGSGGTVAVPGAYGRNVPHLFGIGLVETLAIQIRQQIMAKYDRNRNGFLDVPSETRGVHAIVEAEPGVMVDFGPLEDVEGDGLPSLNDVIQTVIVDREGKPLGLRPDGKQYTLRDPEAAGFDIAVSVISVSAVVDQQPSIRAFVEGVMDVIFGLPVVDGATRSDRRRLAAYPLSGAWAGPSNAGALQLRFPPNEVSETGPYVSEGEVDLLEWFLANNPRPAVGPQTAETRQGRRLLGALQCTGCHVQNWRIEPRDERTGLPGDRRFFDLDVNADNPRGRLEGKLRRLTNIERRADGSSIERPAGGGFSVDGIYSDLRYHDVGEKFYEYRTVKGTLYVNRRFRTTPLWGAGSTAPYGHDGRSSTIDDVIRRHGGEALESAQAYRRAKPSERAAVVAYLRSLALYQTDFLPADLNGDGRIDSEYRIEGLPVGPELFRPELLFRTTPHYRGWTELTDGDRYFSYDLLNPDEMYGPYTRSAREAGRSGTLRVRPNSDTQEQAQVRSSGTRSVKPKRKVEGESR